MIEISNVVGGQVSESGRTSCSQRHLILRCSMPRRMARTDFPWNARKGMHHFGRTDVGGDPDFLSVKPPRLSESHRRPQYNTRDIGLVVHSSSRVTVICLWRKIRAVMRGSLSPFPAVIFFTSSIVLLGAQVLKGIQATASARAPSRSYLGFDRNK